MKLSTEAKPHGIFWASVRSSDFILFFKDFIYLFLERGRETKRGGETSMCGCLSHVPFWGPDPQHRHVP